MLVSSHLYTSRSALSGKAVSSKVSKGPGRPIPRNGVAAPDGMTSSARRFSGWGTEYEERYYETQTAVA